MYTFSMWVEQNRFLDFNVMNIEINQGRFMYHWEKSTDGWNIHRKNLSIVLDKNGIIIVESKKK